MNISADIELLKYLLGAVIKGAVTDANQDFFTKLEETLMSQITDLTARLAADQQKLATALTEVAQLKASNNAVTAASAEKDIALAAKDQTIADLTAARDKAVSDLAVAQQAVAAAQAAAVVPAELDALTAVVSAIDQAAADLAASAAP